MSQKIENILNLALDATPEERERAEELEVGYDPKAREWELIVKYSGTLEAVNITLNIVNIGTCVFQNLFLLQTCICIIIIRTNNYGNGQKGHRKVSNKFSFYCFHLLSLIFYLKITSIIL